MDRFHRRRRRRLSFLFSPFGICLLLLVPPSTHPLFAVRWFAKSVCLRGGRKTGKKGIRDKRRRVRINICKVFEVVIRGNLVLVEGFVLPAMYI